MLANGFFCMRFFKPLHKAKELVEAGRIGRLVTARSFTGAYLPDWHPWEDYRSFYMAKKDQGGVVLKRRWRRAPTRRPPPTAARRAASPGSGKRSAVAPGSAG